MSRFTSYYLYQRYEKVGDGEWTPTYPNEYSISGDSSDPMPLVIKEQNDANCGYYPPIYRWTDTDDTICVFEDEHDYSQDYLTFDIVSAGTITWCASALEIGRYIDYSLDNGETWTTILSYVRTYPYPTWPTINVNVGDKLLVRGTNREYCINSSKYSYFGGTAYYNLKGNIMSLIYGENYNTSDILPSDFNSYTFSYLFNNSRVINAEHLILPATTLRSYCYSEMFSGCTSLTTAPELPATTLANYCYYRMFRGCTGLTTAPVLSATTLVEGCYNFMFNGCSNLNYIKCLAIDISATSSTNGWVSGVASTGTFVKASSMSNWTTGNNGIPNNWTIQNA